MKTAAVLLGTASLAVAYFSMAGAGSEANVLQTLQEQSQAPSEYEKRLLAAAAVGLDNKRPEPGYKFIAPGPNDSRGPCPALNLLGNYGYLPCDGYVTLGQVVEATARGFNIGTNLSTLLSVFAVLTDDDIEAESCYIGAGAGNVGGLNRHSTVEADISLKKEEFYLGCGDNNQYLYLFPFPGTVTLGAYVFYPNFFSDGTYKAAGVANYESITNIIGPKLSEKTGEFEYIPKR